MSCETCKRAAGEVGGDRLRDSAEFQSTLQSGMHAMAQPLTLLRSYFYLAQTGAPLSQQLLDDATAGLEQLCVTFRLMQELVAVRSSEACPQKVPLASVLAHLIADAEVVFAGTALTLKVKFEEGIDPHRELSGATPADHDLQDPAAPLLLQIDPVRTRHAIVGMLQVVREYARQPSLVRCQWTSASGRFEMVIEPEYSDRGVEESSFNEVTRLHFALARANASSEQATVEVRADPFALILGLPVKLALASPVA